MPIRLYKHVSTYVAILVKSGEHKFKKNTLNIDWQLPPFAWLSVV